VKNGGDDAVEESSPLPKVKEKMSVCGSSGCFNLNKRLVLI
jgi:hypothetical protein